MASAVCSCGEMVHVDGLDVSGLQRLIAAVRAARFGVLSGEVSAMEGIDEIQSALYRALRDLPGDLTSNRYVDDSALVAQATVSPVA